ncbi:O-fucosyltransferase 15-like [Macadamia integrifolia]|uniref:O-fucosyltransferase 15-like n=1 Tax=Macadamia integrifolia TaxID=60698 RepID=UPI001C53293D|nr:O-fucosyltransferase 15-like [Macadamia integrifolia]
MASDLIIEAGDRTNEEEEEEDAGFPEIAEIRVSGRSESSAWSSSFNARSHSTTPRSRKSSPRSPFGFRDSAFGVSYESSPSRFSNAHRSYYSSRSPFHLGFSFDSLWWKSKFIGFWSEQRQQSQFQLQQRVKRKAGRVWYRKRSTGLLVILGLLCFFFLMNWWMLLHLQDNGLTPSDGFVNGKSLSIHGGWSKLPKKRRPQKLLYARMLALAAHALAEGEEKSEPKDLWVEPLIPASAWTPCADQRNWEPCDGNNGYIIVTANGGINQQRVAVCNIVAIARLLNATLVVPKFLYSSVWRDVSQFSDIYQEEHFINYLKPDIRIVKELPVELQSLDLAAIGSIVTDVDIMKEAKPSFFLKHILPILLQNRVVHFLGFGNRLAFDPLPFQLQRLRCRCNFHALEFVPKIQEAGALIIQRLRQHKSHRGPLDHNLVGLLAEQKTLGRREPPSKPSRYLALHLRFEIDMVSHSLCDFGGGEEEREELEAYRAIHFPALTLLKKTTKLPSAAELRTEGKCPLTPEEAALMLAALGVNRKRHIFLAGAQIYGGKSRLRALTNLYPNLVTKESLLSPSEIEPFMNFSSQLAALDFIGCAAADAFAMTDSGSQLSSLVSGYRMYYGGGRMPTIRPNKRRLSSIFLKNSTIEWKEFEDRVRKAVKESKQVQERPIARSIYRHPRCRECMCTTDTE